MLRTAREASDDIRRKAEERSSSVMEEAQAEAHRLRTEAAEILSVRTAEAESAASDIVGEAEARGAELRASERSGCRRPTPARRAGSRFDRRERAPARPRDARRSARHARTRARRSRPAAQPVAGPGRRTSSRSRPLARGVPRRQAHVPRRDRGTRARRSARRFGARARARAGQHRGRDHRHRVRDRDPSTSRGSRAAGRRSATDADDAGAATDATADAAAPPISATSTRSSRASAPARPTPPEEADADTLLPSATRPKPEVTLESEAGSEIEATDDRADRAPGPSPDAAAPEATEPASGADAWRARHGAAVDPLVSPLVKRAKRAAQDDQNALLDAVRRHKGRPYAGAGAARRRRAGRGMDGRAARRARRGVPRRAAKRPVRERRRRAPTTLLREAAETIALSRCATASRPRSTTSTTVTRAVSSSASARATASGRTSSSSARSATSWSRRGRAACTTASPDGTVLQWVPLVGGPVRRLRRQRARTDGEGRAVPDRPDPSARASGLPLPAGTGRRTSASPVDRDPRAMTRSSPDIASARCASRRPTCRGAHSAYAAG